METITRPTWTHFRARVAALSRDRDPQDPELIEARQDLREARLAFEIEAATLTSDQRRRLAALILSGAA